jgi:hypothetical protein
MRMVLALLLLLVRLEPLAGAAMCLVESEAPTHECGPSGQPATAPPTGSQPTIAALDADPTACRLAVFCAPGAPVVLSSASPASLALRPEQHQPPLMLAGLHSGDPIVPPIPPPIA